MDVKGSQEKFLGPSLYKIALKVVYQNFIKHDPGFDIKSLPDRIVFDLIRQCFQNDKTQKLLYEKMDLVIFIQLMKYEKYRPKLMKFYQALINHDYPVGMEFVNTFTKMSMDAVDSNDDDRIIKCIRNGLRFGSFLSEASWYSESEQVLRLTKTLSHRLPKTVLSYKLILECCHRLFHTLTMFFKFNDATEIYHEITNLMSILEKNGESPSYILLYTEFSKYSFLKSNYEESFKWIKRAILCLEDNTAISTQIQVLRQASKVCVVKRDFVKAKFLMHQALARAELHYGSGYYKLASLLHDFGFYLLNSDNIEQSASVYNEAYKLRIRMFDSKEKNLHVAIAEEDLAYALYVLEYSSGYFECAMKHAESAIKIMKNLLPPGNLMLSSANRVKALILEEQALDSFLNNAEEDITIMLEEAEKLHQDALSLTKHTFGEENTLTAKHYGNLGRLYQSMKKYEDAEQMHLKAIQIKEKILGPEDYEVGLSVGHLASLYNYHMEEYEKAEQLYYRSIKINLKLFSESYSGLEYDYRGLIHVYEHLNDRVQSDKFNKKLTEWTKLRSQCIPDAVGPDFYKVLSPAPIDSVKNIFDNSASTSTA